MRLSPHAQQLIKTEAQNIFGAETSVYLFGSRVDDAKRGGDIDLYLEPAVQQELFEKKIRFLTVLQRRLGEQKIDLVLKDSTKELPIYQIAKSTGIAL